MSTITRNKSNYGKRTFHAKMGSIKNRNDMDLTEAEDITTTVQIHWKVSVKFAGILNKSHNWKKYSNNEVTTLLKRSIQTAKGPVVASRITFLVNRVRFRKQTR